MADSEDTQKTRGSQTGGGIRNHGGEKDEEEEATGSHGVAENLPDMLKNTPSNIERLADEIEQCEGRKKYLAHTISPSDGGDARWYFCKAPLAGNELAASVPHTEIVGKGDYFRFGMRDSLAIEASFLQREEELLSSWWNEFAECSEGPGCESSSIAKLNHQSRAAVLESAQSRQLYPVVEERVGIPVKGGLYEVDLVKRHCFPVYWIGENWRVLRGHWFARKGGLDWLPLREDVAEQLEFAYRGKVWHRRTFQMSGLFAARVDLQGSTPGLHALFTGEDDTWEAWLNVDASGVSNIFSFAGKGIILRRGYAASQSTKPTQDELRQQKEEYMDDYCSKVPVQHLVFMVHGIGQRLEKSNLVDDVSTFRHITESLAERNLTSYQRDTQRVLFIPCQWRKGLKLSGESAVEKITLDGVRGLRVMLSATAHDILYYMSPIYCQDIINSVTNQLNCLYLKFLKRNPGYNGKVSLYGHSLGSVLSYDILCHQETLSSPFPMDWFYKEHTKNKESSPGLINRFSGCTSAAFEDNSVSSNTEERAVAGHIGEDDSSEQPTLLVHGKEKSDDSSVLPGYSIALKSAEPHSWASEPERLNGISPLEKDTEGHLYDTRSTLPFRPDECSEASGSSTDYDFLVVGPDGVSESAKEKAIKLLNKEVDALKVRIRELESQSGGKGACEGKDRVSNETRSREIPAEQKDTLKSHTPCIKYTKLEFKVDTFFAVGSPVGLFLALRNIRLGIGKGQEYWGEENILEEMPACDQMFNVFHPFDPVAYRIEPLICKEYIGKRPAIIPYHKGGKRLHIEFQEFKEDLALRSQAVKDRLHLLKLKVLTLCQSRDKDNFDEPSEDTKDKEERTYGSIIMERLTGSKDGRLDHVLQDKTFQHPYISALGSHTNYWRDHDTALFILKHLYRDISDEDGPLDEIKDDSPKDRSNVESWTEGKDALEEELPLTFADQVLVRNLSKRANETMKS